jgi:hypothetical protein
VAENQNYPCLCFQKLGEVSYETFSSALSTLAGGGLLTPDEELEDHIRNMFDLPKKMEVEETGEEDLEDPAEGEDTTEMDDAATEAADHEEATAVAQDEADQAGADDQALADKELSKLEDQLKKLEASETENVAHSIGANFTE